MCSMFFIRVFFCCWREKLICLNVIIKDVHHCFMPAGDYICLFLIYVFKAGESFRADRVNFFVVDMAMKIV